MENKLTFIKDAKGAYIAEFVSSGNSAIHICRESNAALRVLAAIGDLTPVPIVKFGDDSPKNLIFEIGILAGVNITIVSNSEVTEAMVLTEE